MKRFMLEHLARQFNDSEPATPQKNRAAHNFRLICVKADLVERVHTVKAQGKGERS
jgi:hypothetical protein